MKKIVALALSLVMVLGLATTAFAAIPVWTQNGATVEVDLFDGTYNTKVATGTMVFNVAKAPVYDAAGNVTTPGNVAYYVFADSTNGDVTSDYEATFFVEVSSIPVDANAANYVLVKVADPTVAVGKEVESSQTAANQVRIMKMVAGVHYAYTAEMFSAWGTLCGQFKAPADVATQKYATFTAKGVASLVAVNVAADNTWTKNLLIGNDVYAVATGIAQTPIKHAWVPTAFDAKTGAPTEYTCSTCKTVGKVINASVNAPAGSTVEKLGDVLIAFNYTVGVPAAGGNTVQSAQTFDAGIAMYVGMSVMAAAGSAVVLKKKD